MRVSERAAAYQVANGQSLLDIFGEFNLGELRAEEVPQLLEEHDLRALAVLPLPPQVPVESCVV